MRGSLEILAKAFLGGVLIAVLLSCARRGHYVATGLLVSVPAISLYTWWWIGREDGVDALRIAVRSAAFSAIPWVTYLVVVYLLAGRLPLWLTLACGVGVYLVVASAFLFILTPHA